MTFRPRLDVLPAAQRRLWPALADVPDTFVLYGGSARCFLRDSGATRGRPGFHDES